MRVIARDPECRARFPLTSGEEVSAIEIQRTYLRMVEDALDDGAFTDGTDRDWAPSVCARWRRILDALEGAPNSLDHVLDWRVKQALYSGWARSKGFSQDDVEGWNRVVLALQREMRARRSPTIGPDHGTETGGRPMGGLLGRESLRKVESVRREWMLSKGDVERFFELRECLFEADTRYGLVDGRGTHKQLAKRGVLQDDVEDVGDIAAAIEAPPPRGRARIRGEVIRRLSQRREDFRCDWEAVARLEERGPRILEILDLADPYAESERWVKASSQPHELVPWVSPVREDAIGPTAIGPTAIGPTAIGPTMGLPWHLERLRRGQAPNQASV